MPIMTANILVDIVKQKSPRTGCPIVDGDTIKDYCDTHGINYGKGLVPANKHFWDSDLAEAAGTHRLAKFKLGPGRFDPVGWCLVADVPRARAQCTGWTELTWGKRKWNRPRAP